jgi:hypothetical protein
LSRLIRLYEKKRGDRRTGLKSVGNLGEALFFGLFFSIGCAGLVYMLVALAWPEWRANRQFAPARCTIVDKYVGRATAQNAASLYRPEFRVVYRTPEGEYTADALYDVMGLYSSDRDAVDKLLAGFEVGQEYPCWYDPIDQRPAVLARGYSPWLYVSLLIPLSFMLIGGGRLIYTLLHWNTSQERRALLNQRTAQIDLFDAGSNHRALPTVPTDANVTNSPGTTLAYRLPIATRSGWVLFATTAACLLWNGVVAIFVIRAVGGLLRGEPQWMLVMFVVPLVAAGIGLVAYLVRQVIITTGMGPTRLEISAHPLVPGQPYELFLSQAGRLAMRRLEIWLACDEKATYHQGTDMRTETRRVFQDRCFVRTDLEINRGLPFESRCHLRVPPGAMHSFQADHNEVIWKLVVKGSVIGWPDYEREFQIVVNPAPTAAI